MEAYCKCSKCGGQAKVDTSMVLTTHVKDAVIMVM